MDLQDTWVLIPAYNEEETIGPVIESLQKVRLNNIVVVDDGSTDRTAEIARQSGGRVIAHRVNCGKGSALATGFHFLRRSPQITAAITFDGDGQHRSEDALKVVSPILEDQLDVVLGSRLLENSRRMPFSRRAVNQLFNLLIRLLYGVRVTDSQSGLRAFSPQALQLIDIHSTGYEVESDIFSEIGHHNLAYGEVPIKSIYTGYSMSKGQNLSQALNTLRAFLMRTET